MSNKLTIKAPSPGESVTEVQIMTWLAQSGDFVHQEEAICEIETEKVTLTVYADKPGILTVIIEEGETITPGTIIAEIEIKEGGEKTVPPQPETKNSTPSSETSSSNKVSIDSYSSDSISSNNISSEQDASAKTSPAARRLMNEKSIQLSSGSGRDGRITHQDVQKASLTPTAPVKVKGKVTENGEIGRKSTRRPMSMLRRRVAETLVAAKNNTAMLTTFNEVDMSAIIKIRAENQEKFMTKHGIKLGYMSFFAQAICQAIKEFPLVNGQIDQSDIITFDHIDLGVAVSTDRGLIVPVVKNAEKMSHAQLEHSIANLAEKARIGKITLEDLEGGTFTLTNGGIFGSMLSTPILNPPQSGILGMHNIVKRAVVIEDEITIRPMMYIALSYDHRIIDGRESVGFLIKVKELLESPVIPEM